MAENPEKRTAWICRLDQYPPMILNPNVLQEAEEVFATTLDDLEQIAKAENIEIFNRQIFKDDPSAAVQNLKRQVQCQI